MVAYLSKEILKMLDSEKLKLHENIDILLKTHMHPNDSNGDSLFQHNNEPIAILMTRETVQQTDQQTENKSETINISQNIQQNTTQTIDISLKELKTRIQTNVSVYQ